MDVEASKILGFDPAQIRDKYRSERDKRLRADGEGQYLELAGTLARYADEDPYVEPGFTRPSLTDEIEVAILGGGFSGLLAGARLSEAGVADFRIIEAGATLVVPGTGTGIQARSATSRATATCLCLKNFATCRKKSTLMSRRFLSIHNGLATNLACMTKPCSRPVCAD